MSLTHRGASTDVGSSSPIGRPQRERVIKQGIAARSEIEIVLLRDDEHGHRLVPEPQGGGSAGSRADSKELVVVMNAARARQAGAAV